MKKLLVATLAYLFFAQAVHAASLKFDQPSYSANTSETFDVEIQVDPGSEEITSVDAYVLYDSAVLQVEEVNEGSYFPTVLNDLQTGRAYIAGLVDNPSDFKTGEGTIATITFRGLKDGTATLTYDCQTDTSGPSKIIKNDINATNIIACSQNGSAAVTIGAGGAVATSAPTSAPVQGGGSPPVSGLWENIRNAALPGAVLIIVGGTIKFLLKL